jgi:hypothetical protein
VTGALPRAGAIQREPSVPRDGQACRACAGYVVDHQVAGSSPAGGSMLLVAEWRVTSDSAPLLMEAAQFGRHRGINRWEGCDCHLLGLGRDLSISRRFTDRAIHCLTFRPAASPD